MVEYHRRIGSKCVHRYISYSLTKNSRAHKCLECMRGYERIIKSNNIIVEKYMMDPIFILLEISLSMCYVLNTGGNTKHGIEILVEHLIDL